MAAALPLLGRRALVTGSTSGIGLGVAMRLARNGASVMLNGFGSSDERAAAMKAVADEAAAVGSGAAVGFHGADLSNRSEIEDMFASVPSELGTDGIDVLVNNAGVQRVGATHDYPADMFDKIIAVNLTASFHTTQLALPFMMESGYGRLINVASVHGLVASVQKAPYVASKHGIVGFTKAVALEHAGSGITCNAICPGWVLTPLVRAQIDARAEANGWTFEQAEVDLLEEKQPSKQFVTPEQVGDVAAFLCTDSAAQITGVSMPIDGGWTAQ